MKCLFGIKDMNLEAGWSLIHRAFIPFIRTFLHDSKSRLSVQRRRGALISQSTEPPAAVKYAFIHGSKAPAIDCGSWKAGHNKSNMTGHDMKPEILFAFKAHGADGWMGEWMDVIEGEDGWTDSKVISCQENHKNSFLACIFPKRRHIFCLPDQRKSAAVQRLMSVCLKGLQALHSSGACQPQVFSPRT